jgi:hypothetical protein
MTRPDQVLYLDTASGLGARGQSVCSSCSEVWTGIAMSPSWWPTQTMRL